MEREILKEYSNGELVVVWKPKTCIHAGTCVKTLPRVYDPKAKPWIKPNHASTAELKAQIDQCPSGALSYRMANKTTHDSAVATETTQAQIMENGPLLVHGDICITHPDGSTEDKSKTTAFCRCGASANKPYCDGAHSKIKFKG